MVKPEFSDGIVAPVLNEEMLAIPLWFLMTDIFHQEPSAVVSAEHIHDFSTSKNFFVTVYGYMQEDL